MFTFLIYVRDISISVITLIPILFLIKEGTINVKAARSFE